MNGQGLVLAEHRATLRSSMGIDNQINTDLFSFFSGSLNGRLREKQVGIDVRAPRRVKWQIGLGSAP